jgi:hypothetical protein
MDIWFINSRERVHVRAASVHGMLWLQTHFESNHWEAIASEQVTLNKSNAALLAQDAKEAGLIINSVPEIAYSI